mmetsp:Transcript_40138/g.82577  ORF Transcript_40138/g.82577 Transcript_40138/m.82577 type:complete len:243 (+) Transcript_40138:1102-1830(+)
MGSAVMVMGSRRRSLFRLRRRNLFRVQRRSLFRLRRCSLFRVQQRSQFQFQRPSLSPTRRHSQFQFQRPSQLQIQRPSPSVVLGAFKSSTDAIQTPVKCAVEKQRASKDSAIMKTISSASTQGRAVMSTQTAAKESASTISARLKMISFALVSVRRAVKSMRTSAKESAWMESAMMNLSAQRRGTTASATRTAVMDTASQVHAKMSGSACLLALNVFATETAVKEETSAWKDSVKRKKGRGS